MEKEKVVDEKPEGAVCIFCNRTGKMNQVTANILTDKLEVLENTGKAVKYVQMAHDYLAEAQMRELLTLSAFIHDMELADKEVSAKEESDKKVLQKEADIKYGNTGKTSQNETGELG